MPDLPSLVFVPGAWHKPSCYDKLITTLQSQHHLRCVAVTLASASDNPNATFKDDLDAARAAISGETSQGRNVVVIAHSYGGMVGNSAIKGFARSSDSNATGGAVIGLILIASGFNTTGLAFMDPLLGRPPPAWRANWTTGFAELVTPPAELFYHDVPAEEATYWVSQLNNQSLKALFEGGEHTYAGWMDVPAWYIGTVEDRGLPVVAQRMTVGMAREMGGSVQHRELQTSHSPFLSRPDDVVGIMLEAVAAFTGEQTEVPTTATRKDIVVPAVRLWQPLTWYRFGLPLFFGHLLGRGFLVYGGAKRLWRSMFH